MKKLISILLTPFLALGLTLLMSSCEEEPKTDAEEVADEIGDAIEEVADEIGDAKRELDKE